MNRNISLNKKLLFIPFLVIMFLAVLPSTQNFQNNGEAISTGILLDLILSIPIIYYLIIRNSKVPKFSILYVVLLGIVLAGIIIPVEFQSKLKTVKYIGIPLLELGIVSILIYRIRSLKNKYAEKKKNDKDFYDNLLIACQDVFPGRLGELLATEISVFYYLFTFHRANDVNKDEFTYFKKSGIKAVVSVFLFLILIETFVVHILVSSWNLNIAWVLTILGSYAIIQIIAILKSMNRRLISIDYTEQKLNLKYGFGSQTSIPFKDIIRIEQSRKSQSFDNDNISLSVFDILDTHNIIIYLNKNQILHKIYGVKKTYRSISIFIDDKDLFTDKIENIIKNANH